MPKTEEDWDKFVLGFCFAIIIVCIFIAIQNMQSAGGFDAWMKANW